MARPAGSRNKDYEDERQRLVLAMAPCVMKRSGAAASVRELAAAASVSVPTLMHYFGSREGALRAVVETLGRLGETPLARAATEDHGPPGPSTLWFLESLVDTWTRNQVGLMFGAGMALGLCSEAVGPCFVNSILEPSLQAAERRLSDHIARGELPQMDVRAASLALLSPVLLALLHQGPLGGERCRPLDIAALVERHHAAWLRGWCGLP